MKGTRLGEFEEVVLLTVGQFQRDASSARIQEALETHAGRKASLGSIYTVLERLERKAWVASWLSQARPRQGRARRCYRLTDAGRLALEQKRRLRERLWKEMASNREVEV